MNSQAVKVQRKDASRHAFTDAPENVRHHESGKRVAMIGKRLGNNATRGSCNNSGDDGKQQCGGGAA